MRINSPHSSRTNALLNGRRTKLVFQFIFGIICLWLLNISSARAQTLSFTFQSTTGNFCAPSTIRFTPSFSPTPITFYWQFGIDNEESEVLSPTFSYNTPGNYRVTLVAMFENDILEVTRIVSIFGPPNFTITPSGNAFCKPGPVDFTVSSSTPLNSMVWDFGDGTPPQPATGSNISHQYTALGNYTVSLSATGARGCTGTAGTSLVFRNITAVLADTPKTGCVPVNVAFGATVNVPPGSSVSSYVWNYGDGSPAVTTTVGNSSHTYTSANTFSPTLSVSTSDGCSNTFKFSDLSFGTTPSGASLSTLKDTICASELPEFMVSGASKATDFLWDINGSVFSTTTPSTTYKFNLLGTFKVKVIPSFNGCDGAADSLDIFVRGVLADYRFTNSCDDRSIFNFRSTSAGIVNTYEWNFGDGGPIATIARPTRNYPDTGSFPLLLKVRENATGCVDSIAGMIYTARPKLVGTDSFLCRGSTATMEIMENYTNPRMVMNWSILGRNFNNTTTNPFSIAATTHGNFSNRVIINNGTGYCRDTLVQNLQVRVAGPISSFLAPPNVCINNALTVTNQSNAFFPSDPIVAWKWDFGNTLTSNLENPDPVEYFASGNYRIKLAVTDKNGCQDSTNLLSRIRRLPLLRVFPLSQKVCLGQSVQLTALHLSALKWTPASLVSCDTCTQTMVTPTGPTTYTANVTDTFGCERSQTVNLDVWLPFDLDPNAIRDTSICVGSSVQFNLNTTDKIVSWTPTTYLSNSNIPDPLVRPDATTTYVATVKDSSGCFERTATATVEVNPYPVVDMGPDLVLPYDAPFTISPFYGPDIVNYKWQPANQLSCSNCPEPSGRASVSTTFSLIATTSKGCSNSHFLRLTIDCSQQNLLMPTGFTPDKNGLNDVYYPLTRGVGMVKRFVIYNRFGQLIFERNNFRPNDRSFGWDGTFKGANQPSGSYIYFVEAQCDLGDVLSAKGTVTLIR
jgi:gliding motility-associated-like protein